MGKWHVPSVVCVLVCIAVLVAIVARTGITPQGGAIVERFDDQTSLDVDRPILTLYWVEWCPFSVQMMPEWNKLTQRLLGSQIVVRKVDADASPGQAQADGVRAFPTVLLSKNGVTTTFEGERTADMMMRFVQLS